MFKIIFKENDTERIIKTSYLCFTKVRSLQKRIHALTLSESKWGMNLASHNEEGSIGQSTAGRAFQVKGNRICAGRTVQASELCQEGEISWLC